MPFEISQDQLEYLTDDRIWRQVDTLCSSKGLKGSLRAKYFRFLINKHSQNNLLKENSSKAIHWNFYAVELPGKYKGETDGDHVKADHAGRQLVAALNVSLKKHYEQNTDRIYIEIVTGRDSLLRPRITDRGVGPIARTVNANAPLSGAFEHIGNNIEALQYLSQRIPQLNRIEDTAIRLHRRESIYKGPVIEALASSLEQAVTRSIKNEEKPFSFRLVTSPAVDKTYLEALRGAFRDDYQGLLKCFQLYNAAPILNFTILFNRYEPEEVLFGYGSLQEDFHVDKTSVFSCRDKKVIEEFRSSFEKLRGSSFSAERGIDELASHDFDELKSDVISTFSGLPDNRIRQEIQTCRSHVRICVTAWQMLDRFHKEIGAALEGKRQVAIAFWKPRSKFLELREKAIGGLPGAVKDEVARNQKAVSGLKSEYPALYVGACDGQASVSIFWIDNFIYFSPYWVGMNVSQGPHFLVHANSDTGQRLREQYKNMLGSEQYKALELGN